MSRWKLTGWGGARSLLAFPQASSSCGVPVPLEFPSLAWDWLCLTSSVRRAEEESQVSPVAGGGAFPGLQGGPRSPGRVWGTEARRHGEGKPQNASGIGRGFAGGEKSEGEQHWSPGPAVPAGGDQPGAGIWISQLLKAAAAPYAERLEPVDGPMTGQDTRWQISRQKDSAGWASSWLREQGSFASLALRPVAARQQPGEEVEGARPLRLPSGPTRLPDGSHDRRPQLGSTCRNHCLGHLPACRCLGGVGRQGGPRTSQPARPEVRGPPPAPLPVAARPTGDLRPGGQKCA